jgi:hypothetical protein
MVVPSKSRRCGATKTVKTEAQKWWRGPSWIKDTAHMLHFFTMIRDIIGTVSLVDVEDGAPVAVSVMEQKENTSRCELKAAQELLAAVPSLEGKTVTADALHCQKTTARMILEKGGEYFLQIKANQKHLRQIAQAGQEEAPFLPKPALVTLGLSKDKSASKRPNPSALRWTPNPRAMRRWPHPLLCRQRIASCKFTLRTLDMPQYKRPNALQWSRFRPAKMVHFEPG